MNSRKNNVWCSGLKYVNKCGRVGSYFAVFLHPNVNKKINMLMEEFPRLEWLGYLVGTIDYVNNKAIITDLLLPKQAVSVAKVYDIETVNEKTVGVIHSHHSMGNGFSGDDHDTINKNNDISLLVSHEKITGQVRVKTECGCYYEMVAKVSILVDHNVNEDEWKKEIDDKISIYQHKKSEVAHYSGSEKMWTVDEDGFEWTDMDDDELGGMNFIDDYDDDEDDEIIKHFNPTIREAGPYDDMSIMYDRKGNMYNMFGEMLDPNTLLPTGDYYEDRDRSN
jgi:hypothetical protein